jgi:hypothetical protein
MRFFITFDSLIVRKTWLHNSFLSLAFFLKVLIGLSRYLTQSHKEM